VEVAASSWGRIRLYTCPRKKLLLVVNLGRSLQHQGPESPVEVMSGRTLQPETQSLHPDFGSMSVAYFTRLSYASGVSNPGRSESLVPNLPDDSLRPEIKSLQPNYGLATEAFFLPSRRSEDKNQILG
jgi:hypothetical protein